MYKITATSWIAWHISWKPYIQSPYYVADLDKTQIVFPYQKGKDIALVIHLQSVQTQWILYDLCNNGIKHKHQTYRDTWYV